MGDAAPALRAPHRRRTDPDNTWRPDDDDDGLEATAKRARLAQADVAVLRADRDADRAALTALRVSVDGLTGTIAGLVRLLRWAGGIVGTSALLAATAFGIRWLVTLHH